MLREYLIGEAMHALGIPTTRALAAATEVVDGFLRRYEALWLSGVRAKLGLQVTPAADDAPELFQPQSGPEAGWGSNRRRVWMMH